MYRSCLELSLYRLIKNNPVYPRGVDFSPLVFSLSSHRDQRKSQLHHFTIGFQKPGICADSWFLESNGKMVHLGFSLIKNRAPQGAGLLWPPVYTFYSRSFTSTYKFWLSQVGWLFSGWSVSIWRHGNWTRAARFVRMTGSKKYIPVVTKTQTVWGSIFDQRKSQLHHFTIVFQKPGICADQRKSQLHHFTIGFQKPGICGDSCFSDHIDTHM